MAAPTEARLQLVVREANDPASWDAFVHAHPAGTVEHLFAWSRIFADVFRHQPVYLIAHRGSEPVGVLPLVLVRSLLFGRAAVSLPFTSYGGILAADAEAADALVRRAREVAKDFGASVVDLRNLERHAPGAPCREHKVGARLALPGSADTLWAALDRKVRNQVRKAQKEQLTVQQGGPELLDDFYGVFAENMRDLGTPVFPRRLFVDALTALERTSVFVVRKNNVSVAASITLGWRNQVLVPWASALKRYRHWSPNMLLYWSMLETAVSEGYETFDFGRSTRDGGTHQFKLQWGAQDFPLYWESVPIGDNPETGPAPASSCHLDMFIALWQRLPLGIANIVGPRVIRHIV